jgi:hypothetical protein
MNTICCTRFNEDTWSQNERWRLINEYKGTIYNSPVKINEIIPLLSIIYVIEMNNDINKIMGIGIIKNYLHTEKYYKIYNIGNYNRYTYKSNYRIDVSEFTKEEVPIIQVLETLLFKGSKHSKRGHGIQKIPKWILENKAFDFIKFFKKMFKLHFTLDTELRNEVENTI